MTQVTHKTIRKSSLRSAIFKLIYLIAALLAFPLCAFPPSTQSSAQSSFTATVSDVVDGDTVRLAFPEGKESVRLIGIDTMESRENQRAYRQAVTFGVSLRTVLSLGKEASRHLATLLPRGATVTVEYDRRKRDKYGRRLAYLFGGDGVMLNEKMLADGYAATLPISPNLRYQDRFSAVTTKAAAEGRGIWSRISFARASESKLPPKKKAHHD